MLLRRRTSSVSLILSAWLLSGCSIDIAPFNDDAGTGGDGTEDPADAGVTLPPDAGASVPQTPSFSDDFKSTTLNATLWEAYADTGAQTSTGATGLKINIPTGGIRHAGLISKVTHALTASSFFIELRNAGTANANFHVYFELTIDNNNAMELSINNGQLLAAKILNGTYTQQATAYVPATHRYLRLREQSGLVFWEHSPDAQTWTALRSEAPGFSTDAFKVVIGAGNGASAPVQEVTWGAFNMLSTY